MTEAQYNSIWENPLPWSVKKFEDHGYELFHVFDADGELVVLDNKDDLKFICEACNEKASQFNVSINLEIATEFRVYAEKRGTVLSRWILVKMREFIEEEKFRNKG